MYKNTEDQDNQKPLSITCFMKYFKRDYNIGIHYPKKDKCLKCEKFKSTPDELKTEKEKEDFLIHQKEKEDCKMLFLEQQNRSSQNKFLVASFDLQKVLSTPHGPNMAYGFYRKYAVYNFTVYESKSQNGHCYIWEEKNGNRGVNEICTHLHSYLIHIDENNLFEEVSLFCDNCPGQNKNKYVLSMLAYFLKKSRVIKKISITFLVAGHTYMPVDSIHAVIENHVRKLNIQAPSEWPTVIRNSRRRPKPYDVHVCNYKDFLNWKSLATMKQWKTDQGNVIKFSDIKIVEFNKIDLPKIRIYNSYNSRDLSHEVVLSIRNVIPGCVYDAELPINKKKYENLITMCRIGAIHKIYHAEYLGLRTGQSVPDVLPETDVEDEV